MRLYITAGKGGKDAADFAETLANAISRHTNTSVATEGTGYTLQGL